MTQGTALRVKGTAGTRFIGYRVAKLGDIHPYHILEGAGPWGGEWAAYEARGPRSQREFVKFGTRAEAEEHVHLSN